MMCRQLFAGAFSKKEEESGTAMLVRCTADTATKLAFTRRIVAHLSGVNEASFP